MEVVTEEKMQARMRYLFEEGDIVDAEWCRCPNTEGAVSYYARVSGRRGWFHDPKKGGCAGITQSD